ncbi:MAG: dicarboxylate/amino acid:cation symporter [candidate division KSB1 bacterium]|nr:dicarboxylate/amino acid:cation symporter [candidate division KSB1 bacterium]
MTRLNRLKRISLTTWIFIGLGSGILAGRLVGEPIVPAAQFLSDIFLRMLRMAIMPLILTSITSGVVSIGSDKGVGRLGLKTLLYYLSSTLLAILTGQLLVNLLKPGVGATVGLTADVESVPVSDDSIADLLLRIIPVNPFEALANGDVLPVIFFCIMFGIFVMHLQEPHKGKLVSAIEAAFKTMMNMTRFIVWLAPIGVFGINAMIAATTGLAAFKSLGFYFITVLLALFWHMGVDLPLLLRLIGRVNPLMHYKGMTSAMITAFSTSSSMVTLPLNIECVTKRSRVSQKIANFTLPIGATVNMDGTALYECVAAIFIAQIYGIELTALQQFLVVLTALLASIGAAAVPMAGLVMMSIILKAIGLPLEAVGIILAVDRILDMFRTTVNVTSDSCGAVIIARSEGEALDRMGEPAEPGVD